MNPTILGVIGPGFLNQVPTLNSKDEKPEPSRDLRPPKPRDFEERSSVRTQILVGFNMGSCQNYGPFLGTLNNRCRIILGTQKGTIILTTTHTMILKYGMFLYGGIGVE